MARALVSIVAGGALVGTLSLTAPAAALTCAAGFRGGMYPGNPTTQGVSSPMPAEGSIWLVCDPEYCSPPTLTGAGDAPIALEEAERWSRPNFGYGPAEVAVIRYRPSIPFEPGAAYRLNGRAFVVDRSDGAPPPLPRIESRAYVRGAWIPGTLAAHFQLEYPEGLLVADVAPPDDDPRLSIALDFSEMYDDPSRAEFWLGTDDCGGNFTAAGPGVSTAVRFGILDAAGRFSGWTRFYDVEYPDDGVDVPREDFPAGDELPLAPEAPPDEGVSLADATDDEAPIAELDPSSEAPYSAGPSLTARPEAQSGCALTLVSDRSPFPGWWLVAMMALAGRWAAGRRPRAALSSRS